MAMTSVQKEQQIETSFQHASPGAVPRWKLGGDETASGGFEEYWRKHWRGDVGFAEMCQASHPSRLNTDTHEIRQSHCGRLCKTMTGAQQSRGSTGRMRRDHRHLELLGHIHGADNFPTTASLRLTSCAAGEADGY